MKTTIKYQGKVLSNNIVVADTLSTRLLGLMFKDKVHIGGDGLLLDPCNSIHTFFMRFPIDVVFIGKNNVVIKIIRNIVPWRMTWIYFSAYKTLELPAGHLPQDLNEGDLLEVHSV